MGRFWSGWPHALLRGALVRIPLDILTDEFGFSPATGGWNYYRDIIEQYSENASLKLEDSRYYRFFTRRDVNAARTLDEVLYVHDPIRLWPETGFRFYLGTYPWGGLTDPANHPDGTPFGWHYDVTTGASTHDLWGKGKTLWHTPRDKYTLASEWNYTLDVYQAIARTGYHPLRHHAFPTVTMLVRRNGERRAIVVDGHHRLPVLCHFGQTTARVEVVQVIKEAEIERWRFVESGQCSVERAREVCDAFFSLTGAERVSAVEGSPAALELA